jgi:hypothetical protein
VECGSAAGIARKKHRAREHESLALPQKKPLGGRRKRVFVPDAVYVDKQSKQPLGYQDPAQSSVPNPN